MAVDYAHRKFTNLLDGDFPFGLPRSTPSVSDLHDRYHLLLCRPSDRAPTEINGVILDSAERPALSSSMKRYPMNRVSGDLRAAVQKLATRHRSAAPAQTSDE